MKTLYITFKGDQHHQVGDILLTKKSVAMIQDQTIEAARLRALRLFGMDWDQMIAEEDWHYSMEYFPRGTTLIKPDGQASAKPDRDPKGKKRTKGI